MSNITRSVIAHQGGWDETLFVLLPIAIFAGLLAVANRRAAAAMSAEGEPAEVEPVADAPDDDPTL